MTQVQLAPHKQPKQDAPSFETRWVQGVSSDWPVSTGRKTFLGAAWFDAWAQAYVPSSNWTGPVETLLVTRAGAAQGALVVAKQPVSGLSIHSVAGFYQPYRSFLTTEVPEDSQAIAHMAASAIHDKTDIHVLRLGFAEETDRDVIMLVGQLAQKGWLMHEELATWAVRTHLRPDMETFEREVVTKSMVKDVKARIKRLERDHGSAYEIKTFGADADWTQLIEDFASIERRSWLKNEDGDLRFASEQPRKMWSRFLASDVGRKAAVAQVIYIKGQPMSFAFALGTERELVAIANQYDTSVKSYSTGSILYQRMFRDAIAAGQKVVHLGGGDDGYKARWGARPEIPIRNYTFFRPSYRGMALYAALGLKTMADSFKRAIAPKRAPEAEEKTAEAATPPATTKDAS
jgi:hypothetical protein